MEDLTDLDNTVPPDQNTVDQLNELGRCFRLYLANQTLQRDEFILTIGFDFGTSCSKDHRERSLCW